MVKLLKFKRIAPILVGLLAVSAVAAALLVKTQVKTSQPVTSEPFKPKADEGKSAPATDNASAPTVDNSAQTTTQSSDIVVTSPVAGSHITSGTAVTGKAQV